MSKTIKVFSDGNILSYDKGKFDDWCLYFTIPGTLTFAPSDVEVFTEIKDITSLFNPKMIYDDFTTIYDLTGIEITDSVLKIIEDLSKKYTNRILEMEVLLTILYASMVSEERKSNTRLGKRIKRLGIHHVLLEDVNPHSASTYSRNKNWYDIAEECERRGF